MSAFSFQLTLCCFQLQLVFCYLNFQLTFGCIQFKKNENIHFSLLLVPTLTFSKSSATFSFRMNIQLLASSILLLFAFSQHFSLFCFFQFSELLQQNPKKKKKKSNSACFTFLNRKCFFSCLATAFTWLVVRTVRTRLTLNRKTFTVSTGRQKQRESKKFEKLQCNTW